MAEVTATSTPQLTREVIAGLPKVLLHDHLDGGVRPATVLEIADEVGHELPVSGSERTAEGLGEWPGAVTELDAPVLPHMGWDTVRAGADSVLFEGIEAERFYFVHSYGAQHWTMEPMKPFREPVLTWCDYRTPFLAAVENGPLSATQFHPEKSGAAGIRLLRNWISSLPQAG